MDDLISRQALMKEFADFVRRSNNSDFAPTPTWNDAVSLVGSMPSAQPTINGYDIRHLELIAAVMQKENLPPERVTEALTDIGGIVAIITKEFEEALRKAVEQCMT